jgi:enamine deaminase RidA (YjgF/YER057c/UK114 family)
MTFDVLQPAALKDPRPRYSQGIKIDGARSLVFIAGQTAADENGQVVGRDDVEQQAERVFQNLGAVLAAAGASFDHLVMTTTYLTDISYREAYNRVRLKYYGATQPTSTLVVVKALGHPDFLIEIDGIAVVG